MTTTRDTRTATQAYEENTAAIQAAIKKLQAGLKKHAREFKGEEGHFGKHYGYPGDASYVLELLDQAARFICGEEE
jgi:hypothetical protein